MRRRMTDGSDTIGTIQSLFRSLTNDAGQTIECDDHVNLTGVTYSPSSFHLGRSGTNCYATVRIGAFRL